MCILCIAFGIVKQQQAYTLLSPAWVGRLAAVYVCVCVYVCMYVCVHSNTKKPLDTSHKSRQWIVHDKSWLPVLFEVKKLSVKVTESISVMS